jgi:hypothetical protein
MFCGISIHLDAFGTLVLVPSTYRQQCFDFRLEITRARYGSFTFGGACNIKSQMMAETFEQKTGFASTRGFKQLTARRIVRHYHVGTIKNYGHGTGKKQLLDSLLVSRIAKIMEEKV